MTTKKKTDVKLKNEDLYRIKNGLDLLKMVETEGLLTYKVLKNLALVKDEIKVLDEIIELSKEYKETVQPAIEELAKKHARKDEDGRPVMRVNNGQTMYDFDVYGKEEFDKEKEALEKKKEFVDLVKERDDKQKKYDDILKVDSSVVLLPIPWSLLEKIKIKPAILELIFDIIEFDNKE